MRHIALILSLMAAPVGAQSLDVDGSIGVGVTTASGDSWIAPVDLTFALPFGRDFAAELGAFGYALPGKRPHETYAALRWGGLRAGVVRPAYDQVLTSIFDDLAPFRAYRDAATTRAYTTTQAMRVTAVPVGLSWQQDTGAIWYGLSVHGDARGDFSSATAAVRYAPGAWQIAAAVEGVALTDGPTEANVKLGARWTQGAWEAGVAAYHPAASDAPDALALDLHWQATDRLRLSLLGKAERDAPDQAGIAAEWQVAPASSLNATALHDGTENSAHVTLIHRF